MSSTSDLLLLFERPLAPLSEPKGEDKSAIIVLPEEFKTEREKEIANAPPLLFASAPPEEVIVKGITLPDLSLPLSLDRKENFSLFIPYHRDLAAALIEIFLKVDTAQDLFSLYSYLHDRINPLLGQYALSVAVLHRDDTKDLPLPSLSETFPDKFIDSVSLASAKSEAKVFNPASRKPVIVNQIVTASQLDEESRVAYFREDLGINLHHWHWHLINPTNGPRKVIKKDRRGELFYYMHQQVLARYNFERFGNKLGRAKALVNLREPLKEGYYPKLTNDACSKIWPGRSANIILSDINREDENTKMKFQIEDLEVWRERIMQAIHSLKVVTSDGKVISLEEENGIDILGDIVEATDLSVNKHLYGDLHNKGHMAIAFSHDPDSRHLETFGVMGDSATAMRDPIFYRWHTTVNKLFCEYKSRLPHYTDKQLKFDSIKVTSAEISTMDKNENETKNKLFTSWKYSDINLAKGMDFGLKGKVIAKVKHLTHKSFKYTIQVENSGAERYGTCRIFLAPKVDERGLSLPFIEQRELFIEMDKFVVKLKPGSNKFERESKDSSVVIPFDTTFREDLPTSVETAKEIAKEWFCGCGWPAHMLVPRGTPEGLACDLFIMISDYEDDKVEGCDIPKGQCSNKAASFCGIRDKKYPDKRAMGFPMDRLPRDGTRELKDFLTPNMTAVNILILCD